MLGGKMFPEMLVIFNQLTLPIDWEEFIKVTLKYSEYMEELLCEEVTVILFLPVVLRMWENQDTEINYQLAAILKHCSM